MYRGGKDQFRSHRVLLRRRRLILLFSSLVGLGAIAVPKPLKNDRTHKWLNGWAFSGVPNGV
jgi:hypothetical protein